MTDVLNKNKVFKLWPFLLSALIIGFAPTLFFLGLILLSTVPILEDGFHFLLQFEPIEAILTILVTPWTIILSGLGLIFYYFYSVYTFNITTVDTKVSVIKIILGFIGIVAFLSISILTVFFRNDFCSNHFWKSILTTQAKSMEGVIYDRCFE